MPPRRPPLSGEVYAPPPPAGSVSRRASTSDLDSPSGGRGVLHHIYTSQGVIEYESISQEEGDELVEEESVGTAEVNTKAPPVSGGTLHHAYTRSGEAIWLMSEDASPAILPEEMAEELAALHALPSASVSAVPGGLVGGGRAHRFSAPPAPVRRCAPSFARISQRLLPIVSEEGYFCVPRRLPPAVSPSRRRQLTLAPIGTPRAFSSLSPSPSPSPQPQPQPQVQVPISTSPASPALHDRRASTMSPLGCGSAQLLPDSEAILDDQVPLPPGHPHANDNPFMAQSSRVVASLANYSVQRQAQLPPLLPLPGQQQGQPVQHSTQGNVNSNNGVPNSQSFTQVGLTSVSSIKNEIQASNLNGNLCRSNTSGSNNINTPIPVPPCAHTITPSHIMSGVITPKPNGGTFVSHPPLHMSPPPNTPSPIAVPPRAHTVAATRGFDLDGLLPPGMVGNPPLMTPMMPHYSQHVEVAMAHRRLERDVRNKQDGVLVDVEDGELW